MRCERVMKPLCHVPCKRNIAIQPRKHALENEFSAVGSLAAENEVAKDRNGCYTVDGLLWNYD